MKAKPKKTVRKSPKADAALSDAELEKVTGGGVIDAVLDAYVAAVGKRLPPTVQSPTKPVSSPLHMR